MYSTRMIIRPESLSWRGQGHHFEKGMLIVYGETFEIAPVGTEVMVAPL